MRRRKKLAVVLCAAIIFTVFFAVFFTAAQSGHLCTGEDCPVCRCEALVLGALSLALITISVFTLYELLILAVTKRKIYLLKKQKQNSLTSLKVKLSD